MDLAAKTASKFTTSTTVASAPLSGAEMMTLRAPAARCPAASSRLTKRPVDSITTSASSSAHGSIAGFLTASARIGLARAPKTMSSPSRLTSSRGP